MHNEFYMTNYIEFTALKAKQGDAFVFRWEEKNAMLIDGGIPSTLKQIQQAIENYKLKFIFVTHVDYDHIGGLVRLVKLSSFDMSNIEHYMNYPELAITPDDDTQVGFAHGEDYATVLKNKGCKVIPISDKDRIKKFNITIEVLSPKQSDIELLSKDWNANRIIEDEKVTYNKRQQTHGDIINRTSVSLLINYSDKKFLMLADSHPDIITNKLVDMGYSELNPITVDLLKISHHGSKHNTTIELLKMIKTDNYYISTNGSRYNHPDKEVFDYILKATTFHNAEKPNIYTNYDLYNELRLKLDSNTLNNINITHKECLKYYV